MTSPPRFIREPLARFLLIGAVLAGLYSFLPEDQAVEVSACPEPILVTQGRLSQLAMLFERTWQRAPTAQEMDGIIRSHVREEVLYRAGRELGLGEDDTIVRRRIAQKMAFLLEPAPGELVPDEADLAEHLATHKERFARPARVSFEQIFIDPSRQADNLSAVIESVQAALRRAVEPAELGDPTLVPAAFDAEPIGAVTRVFGEDFARSVKAAAVGEWTGPVRSPDGVHLVRVGSHVPARDPQLSEVRDAVAADWEDARRRAVLAERLKALEDRYTIEIEHPDGADGPMQPERERDIPASEDLPVR